MIQDDILRSYRITKSIKRTARELEVSECTVHKALLSAGVISTPLSERIKELIAAGMPQKDIAKLLHTSISQVSKHTLYSKGSYLNDNKSINALRIKKCRERKKSEGENKK